MGRSSNKLLRHAGLLGSLRSIMKTLTISGTLSFCPTNPPRPCGKYVYQRVRAGLGNVAGVPLNNLQLRAHVIPYDPMTPAQLACRQRMRDAVAGWHLLTPEQKAQWRSAANLTMISPFNAYISAYLRAF